MAYHNGKGKEFSKDYQPPERWNKQRAMELGQELIDWLNEKDLEGNDKGNMFFEEFLVIEKDLYPDLIRYLKNKFTSFSELIEKASKIQQIKLVKYGVADQLNATMTKFVLINHHGYTSERTENKNETKQEVKIINLGKGKKPSKK